MKKKAFNENIKAASVSNKKVVVARTVEEKSILKSMTKQWSKVFKKKEVGND